MEQSAAESITSTSDDDSRFRLAFDAAPTGVLLLDGHDRIVLLNAAIEKLFGYERAELLGQTTDFLLPARLHDAASPFCRTGARGAANADVAGRRKDGSELPIHVVVSRVESNHGRYTVCSVVDVTERRDVELALRDQSTELERSNRELEQFAYAASHDLREPLRMVATYVKLLEREYGERLDDAAHQYIRFAAEGATRLTRLVSDLLEYARIGPKALAFEPVDCNEVLAHVLESLRARIEQAEAEVVSEKLPTVQGDPILIGQVLQNLVENGVKFRAREAPRIRISAEPVGDAWHIHVADNGLGIEPRFHGRIFDLFQRLHTHDHYPGTGMGLAFCKKVIERHGGRVWVESEPGRGSVFSFSLPALRAMKKPPR